MMTRHLRTVALFTVKLAAGALFAFLCLIAVGALTNLVLPRPGLSINDMHVAWLLSGKDYFVTSSEWNDASHTRMYTNDELVHLDNPRERFTKEKEQGTFRIFTVGGSTTRGWPFHYYLSYPRLLSLYLKDLLPGRKVEVINAGFMGSDSFSDIQLVRELLEYHPDLILLYEGRNEAWDLPLHRSYLSLLLKLHTFLNRHCSLYGMANRLLRRGEPFDHAEKIRRFASKSFVYDERLLRESMLRNLDTMVGMARGRGCAVVVLTQVSHSSERAGGSSITKVNAWLREFAKEKGTGLVDVDQAFCESGIPENDLIIPLSIHPDCKGYVLMARTVCRALAQSNVIAPAGEWQWPTLRDDAYYYEQLGLTTDGLAVIYTERVLGLFSGDARLSGYEEMYRQKIRRLSEKKEL